MSEPIHNDLSAGNKQRVAPSPPDITEYQHILIDGSIDGIVACDKEKRIIIFNKKSEQLLGYEKSEAIGNMRIQQLFSPKDAEEFQLNLYSEAFGGKNRLFLYEAPVITKNGDRIFVQISAFVLYKDREEIGIAVFLRDLREVRELAQRSSDQTQLLHQDKMISLGELAASVVHEINNPISGILNYNRLMLKIMSRGSITPESQEKFLSYLKLMESQLSRCSKIVVDLLAFSRRSKQEFTEVDLNEVIARCVALSDHRLMLQNVQRNLHLQPEIPKVYGDFNQLQQCMVNLIFNAIDAMPDGGVLTIRSCSAEQDKEVIVGVEDSGCGIAEENLHRIFDAFFTTKDHGLGLGLSTVRSIVMRHKGIVAVESELGKGTVFRIRFPAVGHEIKLKPTPAIK